MAGMFAKVTSILLFSTNPKFPKLEVHYLFIYFNKQIIGLIRDIIFLYMQVNTFLHIPIFPSGPTQLEQFMELPVSFG